MALKKRKIGMLLGGKPEATEGVGVDRTRTGMEETIGKQKKEVGFMKDFYDKTHPVWSRQKSEYRDVALNEGSKKLKKLESELSDYDYKKKKKKKNLTQAQALSRRPMNPNL